MTEPGPNGNNFDGWNRDPREDIPTEVIRPWGYR
jgi:hypothetical protein